MTINYVNFPINLNDNIFINMYWLSIKEIFIDGSSGGDYTSVQSLYNDNGDQFKLLKLDPETVCLVPYSSGTTGLPKGVLLAHRDLLVSIIALRLVTSVESVIELL